MKDKTRHSTIEAQNLKAYSIFKELALLMKMRLSLTVVFSSVMGYAIMATVFDWSVFFMLGVGGALVTGAANALNEVLERDFDVMMQRTKERPVASGRMSVSNAVLIAGLSALVGTLVLTYVHPLAGFLGMLSLVLYAFVYTPMKRIGPVAVYVGAVPGALPVLIGTIVGAEDLTALGLILFGIQFFWQLPHFWAIAWIGHEDYTKAGFRLLPTKNNLLKPSIGTNAMVQALFILPILGMGLYTDAFGWLGALAASAVTLWYAWKGFQLYRKPETPSAKKLMYASFAFLPAIFTVFFIESMM